MKVMVSKFFFLSYPKAPLTSLRLYIENGCVDKLEMPQYSWEENLELAGNEHEQLDEYRKVFNRILYQILKHFSKTEIEQIV